MCIAAALTPWTLWYLGYPDQGLAQSHEAVTLAQQSGTSFEPQFCLEHGCHVPSVPP